MYNMYNNNNVIYNNNNNIICIINGTYTILYTYFLLKIIKIILYYIIINFTYAKLSMR